MIFPFALLLRWCFSITYEKIFRSTSQPHWPVYLPVWLRMLLKRAFPWSCRQGSLPDPLCTQWEGHLPGWWYNLPFKDRKRFFNLPGHCYFLPGGRGWPLVLFMDWIPRFKGGNIPVGSRAYTGAPRIWINGR